MAYFVTVMTRVRQEVANRLRKSFGDKAEVTLPSWNTKIRVTFAKQAGFPAEEHRLSQEQIDAGVCGGGKIEALDGKTFEITIEGVKDP